MIGTRSISALSIGLVLAALYGVLVLPGVIAALAVWAELGTVRLALDWPLARSLPLAGALDPVTLAKLPVLDLDLARGLPVSRSYTVSLAQLALSGVLAVLIAATGARALATGSRMLGLVALAGLPVAMAPGLLGHCVGEEEAGGLFLLLGLGAEDAAAFAGVSPWLQGAFGFVLTARMIHGAGQGPPSRKPPDFIPVSPDFIPVRTAHVDR
ncbi:MAG: hypothetical protein ACFB6R_15840 [Alphaproteobacteria bacterium]